MNQARQLLNQLFNDGEMKDLERDTASVLGSLFIKKLKDILDDDFFKLVVAIQNKEPEKAREILRDKNIDINKIINDIVELVGADSAQNLSESLDMET